MVRHGGEAPLPPPLAVLYTPSQPPLGSLPGDGVVYRLDDGSFPVFVAARREGPEWVLGLGLSPEDASRALDAAPPL